MYLLSQHFALGKGQAEGQVDSLAAAAGEVPQKQNTRATALSEMDVSGDPDTHVFHSFSWCPVGHFDPFFAIQIEL